MEKGAIHFSQEENGQFLSPFFTVPKPDGSYRFILNLKGLNQFIDTCHFKIEDLKVACKLISQDDYMASIDLQDAYLLIPIHKDSIMFLKFRFKNRLYHFSCLPFGLSKAPYVFTKVLKPVMAFLRTLGFISVIYLDDILCIGRTREKCSLNVDRTVSLLRWLGFIINDKKCNLSPSKSCKFLGFIIDSSNLTLYLPTDKKKKLIADIKIFSAKKSAKIFDLAQIIGKLVAACPGVKYGWVYTKRLERFKISELQKNQENYNAKFVMPEFIILELQWWLRNLPSAFCKFKLPDFYKTIFTDASDIGWGATDGEQNIFGVWDRSQLNYHINFKELLAVKIALENLTLDCFNCHILLRIDNTTAISYINKMGGVRIKAYCNVARDIWKLAEEKQIILSASYIPSRENIDADRLSRLVNSDAEWELAHYAFKQIINAFGIPDIDLFATRNNRKCKKFCSWLPDEEAFQINAFTLNWNKLYFYAFPPFVIILRVLEKVQQDKARGILIVPYWPNQPWFPVFQRLIVNKYLILGPANNLLLSLCRKKQFPGSKHLQLIAATVSGNLSL